MRKNAPTIGFGFNSGELAHHFAVVISSDEDEKVIIEERFAWNFEGSDECCRPPLLKAVLDRYRWSRIADVVRTQFNRRLREVNLPVAKWQEPGENLLAPHFGKELVLLIWAIEDIDPSLLPNAVANWLGLQPEERWWLYTTINATSGHPEHSCDRGWRKAIKIAFAENPVPELPQSIFTDNDPVPCLPQQEDLPSENSKTLTQVIQKSGKLPSNKKQKKSEPSLDLGDM